ncbi:MAG: 1-acyl-sn-glycerol-3-phosphate acyltransferase [Thermomicrobiales bacterium]|jgi:1-acyl-sn-glycerol-3-phosphate acyltransferase|nr:1-acyl-sn-glycerol-3-phosphate acyltransferase [Thermomicrobiales bacterium]MEA2528292.1 1-acyl-sn-glycerol-3-phosphate acyltransferase [Thermomicrobiales bacterium]
MSEQSVPAKPATDLERFTIRGRPRRVVRAILLAILRLAIGLRVEHVERAPKGAVLVVSNHLHNADPVLTNAAYPLPIHYMAKKEVFRIPVLKWILRWAGAFPVDRGRADRSAIRRAEAALAAGIAVGMYPEGTRSNTRALRAPLAGAGMLALRNDVPILPIVVTGTERLPFNGAKGRAQASSPMPDPGHKGIRILFGEPFRIPREVDGRKLTAEEATDRIMVEIARLLPPDYRGVYADRIAEELQAATLPATV